MRKPSLTTVLFGVLMAFPCLSYGSSAEDQQRAAEAQAEKIRNLQPRGDSSKRDLKNVLQNTRAFDNSGAKSHSGQDDSQAAAPNLNSRQSEQVGVPGREPERHTANGRSAVDGNSSANVPALPLSSSDKPSAFRSFFADFAAKSAAFWDAGKMKFTSFFAPKPLAPQAQTPATAPGNNTPPATAAAPATTAPPPQKSASIPSSENLFVKEPVKKHPVNPCTASNGQSDGLIMAEMKAANNPALGNTPQYARFTKCYKTHQQYASAYQSNYWVYMSHHYGCTQQSGVNDGYQTVFQETDANFKARMNLCWSASAEYKIGFNSGRKQGTDKFAQDQADKNRHPASVLQPPPVQPDEDIGGAIIKGLKDWQDKADSMNQGRGGNYQQACVQMHTTTYHDENDVMRNCP